MTSAKDEPNSVGAATYRNEAGHEVLDVRQLRPKPKYVRFVHGDDDEREYRISGSLALDTMISLYDFEAELVDQAVEGPRLREALDAVAGQLTRMLQQEYPDAPPVTIEGRQEALAIIAFLAGNSSVAAAWIDAITAAGLGSGGEKPDAASDNARTLAKEAGVAEPEAEGDLPLASRSRSRSSRSEKSADGGRNGGAAQDAPGKRSGSTSRTRSGPRAVAKPKR